MSQHEGRFEAGNILLPKKAPWLADFETELLAFPNGRYDDQVDALLLFLDWFARDTRTTFEMIGMAGKTSMVEFRPRILLRPSERKALQLESYRGRRRGQATSRSGPPRMSSRGARPLFARNAKHACGKGVGRSVGFF